MPEVVLCSKHKKARLIAPYLTPLGYQLSESDAFDTDSLGTFSGEVARQLSPKAAALTKAQKACELSGAQFGLGSEGSFGGGPMPGFVNWNEELLCLYDSERRSAIYAMASGPTIIQSIKVLDQQQLHRELAKYPEQRWLWQEQERCRKGLSAEQILDLFIQGEQPCPTEIKPDLRAMHCPVRQDMIKQAAKELSRRIQAICPNCKAMDFVENRFEKGLACALCALPTQQIKQITKVCEACAYTEVSRFITEPAAAEYCQFCNP